MSWEVMTVRSQTSSNEMRTIIRDNFKKFWTVPALVLFWMLLWGFLPTVLSSAVDKRYMLEMLAENVNFGYIVGILALGIVSGMTVFAYLRNPGSSNFFHSLPISRSRLFAANFVSGLLMIAGPLVVNAVIMTLMAGNFLFVKWIIMTAVGCFAIFAITAFAAMISGNTMMHLFNAGFFNFILSLLMLVFYLMCESLLLGYETSDEWSAILQNSNALTAVLGTDFSKGWICGIYVLVGIVAMIAALALYKRRSIERTGSSVMFPWVRAILFVFCVFCGAVLAGLFFMTITTEDGAYGFNHLMVIGMIAGAVIVFVIGSLMIDRSAKIFTKRNVIPAACALVIAFAVSAGLNADVIGYNSHIPETADVEAVYLDTCNNVLFELNDDEGASYSFRGEAKYYNKTDNPRIQLGGVSQIGMTSAEAIDAVRDMQQALIKQGKVDAGHSAGSVDLVYQLKDGGKIRRSYDLYMPEDEEFALKNIDSVIVKAAKTYYESKEFKEQYSIMNVRPKYFEKGIVTYYLETTYPEGDNFENGVAIPRKHVASFQRALDQDFQECGFEQSKTCNSMVYASSSSKVYDDYNDEVYYNELAIMVPKAGKHMKAWEKEHQDLLK